MIITPKKIALCLVLLTISVSCQKVKNKNFYIINNLPGSLKEISGITLLPIENFIYAINDSGNSHTLFKLDQHGEIIKKSQIPDAKNKDWEDLAYDNQGNIYIGDFGNNNADRKDLMIYKVSNILSGDIKTSKIKFRLEDQKKFPASKKNRNFDIEGFIYHTGKFYLFTKNRNSKSNFNGNTKLYSVSAQPGNHIAKLITTYKTCKDFKNCFISGAAINSKRDKVALLTYDKIYMLTDFKKDNLFSGKVKKIKLNHFSQKEGICFKNDSTLYIVDEKRNKKKPQLYEYKLK